MSRKLTQGQKKRQRQQVEQARLDERHKVVTAMKQQRAESPQPAFAITGTVLVSENNGVLVNNWRQGWRWFSNLALGAIVAINTTPLPPEVLAVLPPDTQSKVTIGLAVLGIVGRFINQAKRAEVSHDPTA